MNEKDSDGEGLTTESFLFVCKQVGLTMEEMELLDIGDCLDYVETYLEEKSSQKVKKATQRDMDLF